MKKAVIIFILLITSVVLFANNNQKTYLMSDDAWKIADRLCRINGILGPTPISPITEAV